MAITCNFGTRLVEKIKDKFVMGLIKGLILDRPHEKEPSKVLKHLVEIFLKREATIVQSGEVSIEINQVQCFQKNKNKTSNGGITNQSVPHFKDQATSMFVRNRKSTHKNNNAAWNHSGKKNHNFSICKYLAYKCELCDKQGHLAMVCHNKNNIANIALSDNSNISDFNEFELFNINILNVVPP